MEKSLSSLLTEDWLSWFISVITQYPKRGQSPKKAPSTDHRDC